MSTNNNITNKPPSVHEDEYGLEVVSDRLKETTITTMANTNNNDNVNNNNNLNNKPDYRELDLGSPVSPLRTRGSGPNPGSSATTATTTTTTNTNTTGATTTSSSSSSSGSVTGRASGQNPTTQKAHSGELGIRQQVGGHHHHHHARSDSWGSSGGGTGSHPLVYSGGVGGSGGGGSGGTGGSVNSPPLNVLPAGNICPSGRIAKGGVGVGMMGAAPAPRQGALGSGHGYYGHGSIMRSGGSGGGSGGVERRRGEVFEGSDPGRRGGGGSVGGGMDPEELKRLGNEQYKKGHFSEALSLYDRAIGISPSNAAYRSNRAAALTGLGRIVEAVKECEEAVRLDPCYGRAHLRLGSLLVR